MSFNASKCKVIRVTRKRNPTKTTYTIHGHDLTKNKTGKYLRVTIADNLTWNAHVDATSKKTNNSLAFLKRNLASCPRDLKAQIYQALVRPILEYASTSWEQHQIKHLTFGSRPKTCSKIRDRGLQNHQQPQSGDRLPWMGTSLLAKGQLQIGNGVPYHIWTHRLSSATESASIIIEHCAT